MVTNDLGISRPIIPSSPTGINGGNSENKGAPISENAFSGVLSEKLKSPGLDGKIDGLNPTEGVKFSNHALERMASRGITFKPEDMLKINQAVEKAATKGSKEALVLMGDNALIISVKNRTVVTAMDKEAMKENVFTNIDSTVVL